MNSFQRLLLLVGVAALVIAQTGCTSYKQVEPVKIQDHPEVRVTLTNGHRIHLIEAWVTTDTLGGVQGDGTVARIPVEEIETVEAKTAEGWKSTAVIAAIILGLAAVGGLIWLLTSVGCCDGS